MKRAQNLNLKEDEITALLPHSPVKGCVGIVFTYGIRMVGLAIRWEVAESLSGLYLRNRKHRKLMLGRDIGWGIVSVQHHGVTLL